MRNLRWHHLLKGKMLEGKCNHRMDNLIWTLTNHVIPYYCAKHHCQQFGFEGPNLELQWQKDIEATSHFIKIDNVEEVIQGSHYTVHSQSHPDKHYNVDMDSYTCNCEYFPLISYCKHLAAIQLLFSEDVVAIPIPHNQIRREINNELPWWLGVSEIHTQQWWHQCGGNGLSIQ